MYRAGARESTANTDAPISHLGPRRKRSFSLGGGEVVVLKWNLAVIRELMLENVQGVVWHSTSVGGSRASLPGFKSLLNALVLLTCKRGLIILPSSAKHPRKAQGSCED